MNRIKSGVMFITFVTTAVWAQERYLSARDQSWNGIEIWFDTKIEPPGISSGNRLPGGVIVEAGRVHRVIRDAAHERYFGYDVLLDPSEDGKIVQLRIEPLRSSRASEIAAPGWKLLALPTYPVIPAVHVGDTVALDLLMNAATGQKIVDYLTLRRHGEVGVSREPHDFSQADIEINLTEPQLLVNGKLESRGYFAGRISGPVVWLYLAGHGRFILSLFPNEGLGFQRNGVASAGILSFRDGSTHYRIECRAAVAPGSGTYNVYVVHDAEWRPRRSSEPFLIGSADRAEWVVGNH